MVPYGFSMVAILKFKMAAEDVVENIGTKFFGFSPPNSSKLVRKINFGAESHRIWPHMGFSKAAILKFKMAAEDVVEKIGTKVFLNSAPPN